MLTKVAPKSVSPADVKAMLLDGEEIALVDVREELIYSQSHLLWARCIPLSRLELRFATLVPRKGTRIVLVDDNDGLAERAAAVLTRHGYDDVSILEGGNAGWEAAGNELFSGVYVPSKAFGEFIEHDCDTPNISADELAALIRTRADMVILDSRPLDEFSRVSIPTATNVPGAELVLRARDMAPSPDTLVVVNCAGRTRSIIGAQSLINAGLPNKVVALRNGTMGFTLAGHACDSGQHRQAPSPSSETLSWAQAAARSVAERHGVSHIDDATLARFRAAAEQRTLYLFDVRDPPEYASGHVAGAISAPGGQLVQATDQYIGTLGARIVLVDDLAVRADMTGSWLRQMGFGDVFVLIATGSEREPPRAPVLAEEAATDSALDTEQLAALLARDAATVVDLSPSRDYLKGHIPGAWFAIRSRLLAAMEKIATAGTLVLTSEDGILAGIAANEAAGVSAVPIRYLAGGNAAWAAAGHPLSTEPHMADEAIDTWLKPYERAKNVREAMDEYLKWEVDLLPRVARDGSADFARFRPS